MFPIKQTVDLNLDPEGKGSNSHYVYVEYLSKEARDRSIEIHLDSDTLFSLRLSAVEDIEMDETMMKQIDDYLSEDGSLRRKITYEEYMKRESVPKNSDYPIMEVFQNYRALISRG